MKTKNTFAKVAFVATLILTGTMAQAQSASLSNAIPTDVSEASTITTYSRPLAFEAAIRPMKSSEKVVLSFGKKEGNTLTISLSNDQDQILAVQKIAKNESGFFHQNFDVKDLPSGDYKFILENGSEKLVKKFEIHSNSNRALVVE